MPYQLLNNKKTILEQFNKNIKEKVYQNYTTKANSKILIFEQHNLESQIL